jgi:hypothetical protein
VTSPNIGHILSCNVQKKYFTVRSSWEHATFHQPCFFVHGSTQGYGLCTRYRPGVLGCTARTFHLLSLFYRAGRRYIRPTAPKTLTHILHSYPQPPCTFVCIFSSLSKQEHAVEADAAFFTRPLRSTCGRYGLRSGCGMPVACAAARARRG